MQKSNKRYNDENHGSAANRGVGVVAQVGIAEADLPIHRLAILLLFAAVCQIIGLIFLGVGLRVATSPNVGDSITILKQHQNDKLAPI